MSLKLTITAAMGLQMIKYSVQKCSYCKGKIYHDEDRTNRRRKGECTCSERGIYYIPSFIKSDCSGISRVMDYDNYAQTKEDQFN